MKAVASYLIPEIHFMEVLLLVWLQEFKVFQLLYEYIPLLQFS